MQSEEPTIIQSLENHLAEYGHTTVGQDIAAAILVIKDFHQKAALSAQVQDVAGWQLVPKEPTQEMLDAFRIAETKKRFDIMSAHPTEEPEAGGGTVGYGYRAMLAAAPAKQEGGHD